MNFIWQRFTLSDLSLDRWRDTSYLSQLVGILQRWRSSSMLMQWAEPIGALLVAMVFALAPFVSKELLSLLLFACACFWVLLTLSDETKTGNGSRADNREAPTSTSLADRLSLAFTPIHLLVLLYWSIATVATALSPVKAYAFQGWNKLTLYLLMFALMARVLRSPRIRSCLIAIYLHTALVVSIYGVRQWFFGAPQLATWVDPESPLAKATRVYSYLGNPNLLAAYLLPAIALSLAAVFAWRDWLPKALALTMLVVNCACLILTFSRGGWIGFSLLIFTFLVLLFYWFSPQLPRFWRVWGLPLLLGSVVAALVVAALFVPAIGERVASIFADRKDSSNNFRKNVWAAVFKMIHDRPIIGIGPGNDAFNKVYPVYQINPRYSALSAYSILLEICVESGFIGLSCFAWLLIVTFNQGWLQLRRLREAGSREAFWLMGAIAGMLALLSHGLVDTVWYRPQVNVLWWLMVALIASYYRPLTRTSLQDNQTSQ